MKDVPHHMTEFIKSFAKKESPKEDTSLKKYRRPTTKNQKKKQTKARKRKRKTERSPTPITPEEKQKKQTQKI